MATMELHQRAGQPILSFVIHCLVLCGNAFWAEHALGPVEVSDHDPRLIEVLHVPRWVAVVKVLTVLDLVCEAHGKVGLVVHPFDRPHLTIDLNHHAEASKLNPTATHHVIKEFLRFGSLIARCGHTDTPRFRGTDTAPAGRPQHATALLFTKLFLVGLFTQTW